MSGLVDGTTPYPWPYDGQLAPGRTALVVLGCDDEWWDRCDNAEHVVAPIRRLAEAVALVVLVDQRSRTRPTEADTVPAADRGHLPVLTDAIRVSAAGIDGFFGGPLDQVLRAARCDLLLLAGWGLETTVHSTMRSANDRGYECLLVVDACAACDAELVPAATSMVEMSGGIFGAVGCSESVLAAFGETPDSPVDPSVDAATAMRGNP